MRRTLRLTTYRSASHRSANRVWLFRTLLVLALAALVAAGGSNWRARAQTNRFVAPFGDDVGGTNDCTDPEAPCQTIQHAINISGAGDLIVLASGTYFENVSVTQSVTIQGDGTVASTVNGSNTGSVFNVGLITAAINGLTITNGNAQVATNTSGGGIYNVGTLTVVGCTISGNNASNGPTGNDGGGIFNFGTLTVINSTISGNTAGAGGGIFNMSSSTATVVNSTINGNTSFSGSGVVNNGSLNLTNTIIGGGLGGGADCLNFGTVSSNVNNLIQDGSCSPAVSGNPNLGPLQDNGGPTMTHALLAGSPAIDAGDDSVLGDPFNLANDQRGFGFPRMNASHVDIGAFESASCIDSAPPVITCPGNQTASVPTGQSCVTVNYPAPTATDDCGLASVDCSPPSGSCFPVGTTTVICSAIDTSNKTSSCSFTVTATPPPPPPPAFDICVQDDLTKAIFRIKTATGQWEFENCSKKTKFSGTSSVISSFCKVQIGSAAGKSTSNQASGAVNQCSNVADITVTVVSGGVTTTFKLHDSNFRDSPCVCPL